MKLLRSTWVGVALLSSGLFAPATGCGDDDEGSTEGSMEEADGGAGKGSAGKGSAGKGSAG
ncbi:MAG TPA: hypothetical protein VFN67_09295, partial [Polyangiales bacterium]|nr:hypothetical protein [Polyangiales bacterium]